MTAADSQNTTEDATDELAGLCADLLAEVRFEPFVSQLLSQPAGRWQRLTDLVIGINEIKGDVMSLDRTLSSPTWTAWLEHPHCSEGPGYITVLFFNEAGMSRIWIYNRARIAPQLH